MNAFLEGLGTKVAERWLSLLMLPGLLWVSAVLLAVQLGWRHALDPRRAGDRITHWAGQDHSTGQIVLVLAGLLLAAAAAGLAATWLAAAIRRAWLLPGRRRPARWLRTHRHHRWNAADDVVTTLRADAIRAAGGPATTVGPDIADALARRDAISLERPQRPTWIGDRWLSTTKRVHRAYGLDLTIAWPRLWTLLAEPLRADITGAQANYAAASALVGWALLYGLVGLYWGPALLIAAITLVTGIVRARIAAATLCQLVETAADLYAPALAEQLRIPCRGPLTPGVGDSINAVLRKDDDAGA